MSPEEDHKVGNMWSMIIYKKPKVTNSNSVVDLFIFKYIYYFRWLYFYLINTHHSYR